MSKLGLDAHHCVAMSRRSQAPRNAQRSSSGVSRHLDMYSVLSVVVSRLYKVLEGSRISSATLVGVVILLSLSVELSKESPKLVVASSWRLSVSIGSSIST